MNANIFIAGSGGIGQAVGLILSESTAFKATIFFGDVYQQAIDTAIQFVTEGCSHPTSLHGVLMPKEGSNEYVDEVLKKCVLGLKACSNKKPCPLHHEYKGIKAKTLDLFSTHTIGWLALEMKKGESFL